MRLTRRQLRKMILEDVEKGSDLDLLLQKVGDAMDGMIRDDDAIGLMSTIDALKNLVKTYSDAEILQ